MKTELEIKGEKLITFDKSNENFDKLLDVLVRVASSRLACTNPIEYDYHEWMACQHCLNCQSRKELAALGLKGIW